jgi:hypothetical protein
MHGIARLRLVGTSPVGGETADGIEECHQDDFPQPLPFPTCVRTLPRHSAGNAALAALDRMTLSFERLRAEFESGEDRHDGPGPRNDQGPRAA